MRAIKSVILMASFVFVLPGGAAAGKVELENGDVINGEIVEETDGHVVIESEMLGRVVIPRDKLKKEEPEKPGLFGSRFMTGWDRTIGAGIAGSAGKTENLDVNLRMVLGIEDDRVRRAFNFAYFLSSTFGVDTKNELFLDYQNDWKLGDSPWFLFAAARYDWDQFKSYENRIAANGGVGYSFIDWDVWTLRGQVGAGVAYTWTGVTETRPEGVLGLHTVWKITDSQRFIGGVTYYPDFSDLPEFRLISYLAYSIPIGGIKGLGLRIGTDHEYDSTLVGNNNDLKYFANLTYDS